MGQSWRFVDLDGGYTGAGFCKLGEIFWGGLVDIDWIARPVMPSTRLWSMTDRLAEVKSCRSTAPLLRLPTELIMHIFESCDSLLDMIVLCVAHDILGVIGESILYARAARMIDELRWAGHRLICVGKYTMDNDYPSDVQDWVTQAVERYVAAEPGDEVDEITPGSMFWGCCRRLAPDTREPLRWRLLETLLPWNYQHHVLRPRPDVTNIPSGWLQDEMIRRWERGMPKGFCYIENDSKRFQAAVSAIDDMFAADEASLVLCNLSKAEYVRGDVVEKLGNTEFRQFQEEYFVCVGLAHVLGAYICWSSSCDCSMTANRDVEERLARGKWAGDRFEVTHKDAMRSDIAWKDTTDEAVAWLVELWHA